MPALSAPPASQVQAAGRATMPLTVGATAIGSNGVAGGDGLPVALSGFGGFSEGEQAFVSAQMAQHAALGAERALRLLARGRITLADARLRSLVRNLEECLPLLPARMRAVLGLRTGAGGTRPVSAHAVARRLHISRRRLAVLEIRALRRLVTAARTYGCPRPPSPAAQFVSVSYLSFFSPASPVPSGGVAGGLYLKTPAEAGAESLPPAEAVPASPLAVRPASSNHIFWEAAVAALLGLLLVAYLLREEMGLGPLGSRRGRRRSRRAKPPDGGGGR